MFLVFLKACNSLFSLNKKNKTESTQQDINNNQLQKIYKNQFCRFFRGLKKAAFASNAQLQLCGWLTEAEGPQ
jgi:hypothetical protein